MTGAKQFLPFVVTGNVISQPVDELCGLMGSGTDLQQGARRPMQEHGDFL